jgi:hypothetical protein
VKITIEPKEPLKTGIPESRPHGGLSPLPGCPVCEALNRIYLKDRNKKKPFVNMDKVKD